MSFQVVTGGAGFIGSHIVECLLREGEEVVVVDDFSTGKVANLSRFRDHPRLRIERTTILDSDALAKIFKGADFVFHQAAIPSVQKSLEFPVETNQVNIGGTLSVLLGAYRAGVRRVVFASSSSVYGNSEILPKQETDPAQPLSPYALQKYVGELYSHIFFNLFGAPIISLRYFNVYGPRQDFASEYSAVIPRFAMAMLQGKSPTIYGDGEQSRDFTYVENVVDANLRAARSSNADGKVLNIASGNRTTLNQLVDLLNQLLGTSIQAIYEPPRAGEVRHSQAAIEQARKFIGFDPAVDLKTGLQRTIEWYAQGFADRRS
ncbi:MAG: SDR family oxidoreductase [Acidobacteria bacterium]|nr:SDR family oxidoreductase [Acidobacteriota bacterium]